MNKAQIEDIRSILTREADAIRSIPVTGNYIDVIELLFEKVHGKGGKLIDSGMGKAGHVTNHMASTLLAVLINQFSPIN